MKITCTKENLKKALGLTAKIAGTGASLPILNNLLLKTESGQLFVSSTNLEIAIKTWTGGHIEESGSLTVPARTLSEFVNNTAEEKIVLETKNTDLFIKTEHTETLIKGLPADDFPLIPEIKPNATIEVTGGELAEGLGQVAFATAFSETQPELSGVLMVFEGDTLKLAATDRYRLAEKTLKLASPVQKELRVIVPNRAIGELQRILSENPKTTEVVISDNQILFRTATAEITSRLIEAQYPDYQQIIPKNFVTTMKIPIQQFIGALKVSGLFALDNNNVQLEIRQESSTLVMKSISQRAGSNTSEISGEVTGQDNTIIFNYRYILDCLNHIRQEKVILKLINSSSPAMIEPSDPSGYLYLIMPIRT
ncbi:MAG: DNA polymerase III subunit beta [Patescibacteria group bacterium]|nr:DNA polymerase III subunit beta [Patescibacteria group bacterium]